MKMELVDELVRATPLDFKSAPIIKNDDDLYVFTPNELAAFAESIVRRCALIALESGEPGGEMCSSAIFAEFGIEK